MTRHTAFFCMPPIRAESRGTATVVAAIVASLAFIAAPVSRAYAEVTQATPSLIVQGSTTFNAKLLQPYKQQIEARAGVRLNVIANKSIWGLIALLEGRANVAMISASLAGEQHVAAKTAPNLPYDQLREFEISSTRISFVVHPDNPVRELSFQTVADMMAGRIKNWRDVGGENLPVRVVAVQDGGGTVVAVRKQMLGGKPLATDGAIRMESAKHVIKVVQQERGAIGIAQLGLAQAAKLPEIQTEKYVEQRLNLITLGAPKPAEQAFIDAARSVAVDRKM